MNTHAAIINTFIGSLLFLGMLLLPGTGLAQTATDGDYRTASTGALNWDGASTWQVRISSSWTATATAPTSTTNIYIQEGSTVTVNIATADCKDLHLNQTSGVVTIGANTLQVSGKIRGYTGTAVFSTGADGTFYSGQASASSPATTEITSSTGVLKFIGNTRNITATSEWGAGNTYSVAVEFALTSGQTGTLNTSIKGKSILFSSGTIDLLTNRLAADDNVVGGGTVTINSGATLKSGATGISSQNQVISRLGSGSTRCSSVTLQSGGTIRLTGATPCIDATSVTLSGSVIYEKSGNQTFLQRSPIDANATNIPTYTNVTLSGSGDKTTTVATTVSGNTTIDAGCTLAAVNAFTANGPVAINGSFQVNNDGATGSGTWTYGSAGTLVLNTTSLHYPISDASVFWPASNGPVNVTVQGANGISMNAARTVSGTFKTSVAVISATNLTLNGILQINSGGNFSGSPTYGSSSTLKYNIGGGTSRGSEWTTATSGGGYPNNVQLSLAGTVINMGATSAQCAGNFTVDGSAILNTPTDGLTVVGDVTCSGTIDLGGNLSLAGNWNKTSGGTFTPNKKRVTFNGSASQTITSSGGETFKLLEINNSAGVSLINAVTADSTLTLTNGAFSIGNNTLTLNDAISATSGTLTGTTNSDIIFGGSGANTTLPAVSGGLRNLTINRANGITVGGAVTIRGTLTLQNGTLTDGGTNLTYSNGNLKYDGTSYTTTTTAEFPSTSGPASLNVNNADAGGLSLHANRTLTGSLTIASAKKLNVPAGVQLSVTGATATNGGLVLQSPASQGESGSFLPTGAVTGSVTVERFIPAYTSGADGWHLLSSPVASQAIAPNFTPAANDDDLFRFNEAATDNLPWINYKGLTFSTFTPGEGYLAAYKTAASPKSFAGTLNQSNIAFTNLTHTDANAWHGWHLLGNPFSCAILWNKTGGSWGLLNVEAVAQVMNSGGTYTARNANDPIPAMNGFMVHVASGTNTITIPLAARAHSTTDWYKNAGNDMEKLMLTVSSTDNTTYVETMVVINPESTPGFDMEYDGHFLAGIEAAPQLYSQVGDEKLCVNTLPLNDETRIVSLGFIKGSSDSYTMNCTGIASINPSVSIVLEDTRTGKTQDLRISPAYHFNAAGSDNASRFLLHFGRAFSVNDQAQNNTFHIYTVNNALYVTNIGGMAQKGNVFVYNMTGQQVATKELSGTSETSLTVNLATGYYMVKAVTSDHVYSAKVFIKK